MKNQFRAIRARLLRVGFIFSSVSLIALFVVRQQWRNAAVTLLLSILTSVLGLVVQFVSQTKYHAQQSLLKRTEPFGVWLAGGIERFVVRLCWRIFSKFKGRYYSYLETRYHLYRTQGLKTIGPARLELSKLFIPLRLSQRSPGNISSALIQTNEKHSELSIWSFLSSPLDNKPHKNIAVIGRPGSGKSTLLEHLTLTYVRNKQRQQNKKAPHLIPILLLLRDVKADILVNPPPDLPALLNRWDAIKKLTPPQDWFKDQLVQKKCLIMVDGLDEVADRGQREKVSRWVNQQMIDYAGNMFILTSRPHGYDSDLMDQISSVLAVQPFDFREIQSFILNWYLQTLTHEEAPDGRKASTRVYNMAESKAEDLAERIVKSPPLAAMAPNPLLLTMITTIHHHGDVLPEHRVLLYKELCEVLLGRRQKAKNIADNMTAAQRQAVLQILALELSKQGTCEFSIGEGSSFVPTDGDSSIPDGAAVIAEPLRTVRSKVGPREFLTEIEKVCGLISETSPQVYEFAHRSFQDYLSAVEIKETNQEYILITHINDLWWEETTRLYAAQSDASRVIEAALASPTVSSLTLAAECVEEALKISQPEIRQQLEDTLTAGLESENITLSQLTADVKLGRRLKNLARTYRDTWIDQTYITCSEYQLFINDGLRYSQNRQPDHWSNSRFPAGSSLEPVKGVRPSDALMFCTWLNRRNPWLGFTYSLPTIHDVTKYSDTIEAIGCWCLNGNEVVIGDRTDEQEKQWKSLLEQALLQSLMDDLGEHCAVLQLLTMEEYIHAQIEGFQLHRSLDYIIEYADSTSTFGSIIPYHFSHAVDDVRSTQRADALSSIKEYLHDIAWSSVPSTKRFDYAKQLIIDRGGSSVSQDETRAVALDYARYTVLLAFLYWYLHYDDLRKTNMISAGQPRKLDSSMREVYEKNYKTEIDRAFTAYTSLSLIDLGSMKRIPVLGGIRVSREQERS